MPRAVKKKSKGAETVVAAAECGAKHEHPHEVTTPTASIHVLLRTEPDRSSRTGVSVRAYWTANGGPLQSLHIGGETEAEARWRVQWAYPAAFIETEAPKACCASCAAGDSCSTGCSEKPLTSFKNHSGMAGEALLAVYEDVVGCGACSAPTTAGTPTAIRFEKARKNPTSGEYTLETLKEVSFSPQLQSLLSKGGACKGGACLPWLRIETDPQQFQAALRTARKIGPMKDSRKFYNFVKGHLLRQNQEVFVVILLDVHGQVLGISEISRGARDRVLVPIPDILRLPLVDGATAFVVAHNHPSGKTKPSEADKEVTKSIKEGADAIGILFMDHIIVAADGYYSFNDHGLV